MCKFRDLRADEIECRVGIEKQNGLALLLYKDARCDMNILDETVGAENWQREHYECKGNLFCRVGIRCDLVKYTEANGDTGIAPEWVWKADCGAESKTEAEKGEASDSFKRACVNWGIGRELYSAPFIWIERKDYDLNTAGKCKDKFIVEDIVIQDKKIVALSILNEAKKSRVFLWDKNSKKQTPKQEPAPKKEPAPQTFICADCGASVDAAMAARTQKAFGVCLCKDCGLKRSEKKCE